MKTNKILIAAACLFTADSALSENAQWNISVANKSHTLMQSIDSPMINKSKDRVSYSFKLEQNAQINFNQKPHQESSRQYWLDSSADKLSQGIKLPVSGGSTVIRVSPLTNNKSLQLRADMIELSNNGISQSVQVFADSETLKATGAPFSDQSIAMKVEAQTGDLTLKIKDMNGNIPFVIHVFEPQSETLLNLSANKATFSSGETIQIDSDFISFDKSVSADLQGYISKPDGSLLGELNFNKNSTGSYSANINIDQSMGLAEGLWEAHVFAKSMVNGVEILRDAQTSFAVNLNTAAFNGQLKSESNRLEIGVDVGVAGRYEVRGVLMGTDSKGLLQPIAMTMTAEWLNPGSRKIAVDVDHKMLASSGLKAPFELKNVRLLNQSYMAPVQSVVEGLKLSTTDINPSEGVR